MPSQQSSLRGMRTALIPHEAIVATEVASDGPSKIPLFWTHMYSVPDRSTPCRVMVLPAASTRWLPDTWMATAAPVAGTGVGAGVGVIEGRGLGLAVRSGDTDGEGLAGVGVGTGITDTGVVTAGGSVGGT
jgi:hypothetical protein